MAVRCEPWRDAPAASAYPRVAGGAKKQVAIGGTVKIRTVWISMPVTHRQASDSVLANMHIFKRLWWYGWLFIVPFLMYPVIYGRSSSLYVDGLCLFAFVLYLRLPRTIANNLSRALARLDWQKVRLGIGHSGILMCSEDRCFKTRWTAFTHIVETSEYVFLSPKVGYQWTIVKRSLSEPELNAVMSALATVPLPRELAAT
jgi:hypothetical protein